mmetsp:Transcript_15737/g.13150  ORF Transcript_15737/g.13150 Transcript_15737/m.13150 type:complete len:92 (+) Transcript_15737:211-486(+)
MYNNTNFILNPLRLSIRNLAVHTTKQSLKLAIDEALKEANVKASTRHSVKVTVLVDEERRVPIPGLYLPSPQSPKVYQQAPSNAFSQMLCR